MAHQNNNSGFSVTGAHTTGYLIACAEGIGAKPVIQLQQLNRHNKNHVCLQTASRRFRRTSILPFFC